MPIVLGIGIFGGPVEPTAHPVQTSNLDAMNDVHAKRRFLVLWSFSRVECPVAGYAKMDDVRCGAKTRAGGPCLRQPVPGRSRCPNHGGLSTGPRSLEGMARTLAALRAGYAAWRARLTMSTDGQ